MMKSILTNLFFAFFCMTINAQQKIMTLHPTSFENNSSIADRILIADPLRIEHQLNLGDLSEQQPIKMKAFIFPAVLISYGLFSLSNNSIRNLDYSTKAELQEDHPLFANHADNYMQFAPMVAVYGLNLAGIKGDNGILDQTSLCLLSFSIMGLSTAGVKRIVDRPRPDGSNNYSFPSGHTASAFASAEFLRQEYQDTLPWIGYAGYTVAAATGILRMYNNRHWFSDVVAGAGFGIASTKIAYLIYPHLKKLILGKQSVRYSMVPTYSQRSIGVGFNACF